MKRLAKWWSEWRFERSPFRGYKIRLPVDKYDNFFEFPPKEQVAAFMRSGYNRWPETNWFRLGGNLHWGQLKPEFLEWLKEHGPHHIQVEPYTVDLDGIRTMVKDSHRPVTIRFCHAEHFALFKLTWL